MPGFAIAKIDITKNLIFGFANVSVTKDGRLLEDLQEDTITPAELEQTAYDHVLHFRDVDVMHDEQAIGKLVESMVFTPEKLKALGLPGDAIQPRWWVGYQVTPAIAQAVKAMKTPMFSIGGSATRVEA